MKRLGINLNLLILAVLLNTSCTQRLYTSLDVLRPAETAFSKDVNNLLIVNNSAIQPENYGHKTQLLNENPKNLKIKTDSLSIFCLGALNEELESKDFFNSVQLVPNSVNESSDFIRLNHLDKEQVQNLCSKYNSDAVLSLDRIKVKDDLTEYYLDESKSFLASLEVKYETIWSINYPDSKLSTYLRFNDTIYWESETYIRKNLLKSIPNRNDALIDAALYAGQKSVKRFVPYWEKADRYFYDTNKKLLKQGMDSVYYRKWDAAIKIWESASEKYKSEGVLYQVYNNLAIANEIIGNIDKAMEYAKASLNILENMTLFDYKAYTNAADYYNELIQRKAEIEALKVQLGE